MKIWLLILFLFWGDNNTITRTNQLNNAKKEAEKAFNNHNYAEAVNRFHYLIDTLGYNDPKALLNLAHAYYLNDESEKAISYYNQVSVLPNREAASWAYQQLGILSEQKKEYKHALEHFKNALKANPQNQEARFNYELLKKKLANQEQQDENQQNEDNKDNQDKKDQDKKEEQNKDKKGEQDKNEKGDKKEQQEDENKEGKKEEKEEKEGSKDDKKDENGDENKNTQNESEELSPEEQQKKEEEAAQQARQQRFEDVDMNEEKAKMILNAMRQNEKQYLQQLKKEPTKKPDSGKPDW